MVPQLRTSEPVLLWFSFFPGYKIAAAAPAPGIISLFEPRKKEGEGATTALKLSKIYTVPNELLLRLHGQELSAEGSVLENVCLLNMDSGKWQWRSELGWLWVLSRPQWAGHVLVVVDTVCLYKFIFKIGELYAIIISNMRKCPILSLWTISAKFCLRKGQIRCIS